MSGEQMKQHVWKRLHTKPVLSEDESPLPLASPVHPEGHHPFPGLMFCQTHLWDLRQVSAQLGCNWAAAAVQSPSCGRLFVTPWTAARQASLSLTSSRSLPKFKSIESVMPSNHLIFCHPLLLLPSIFPSIRVFSNESALRNRWPKNWSFSFSVSPSNEYSKLISFRIDWYDLLAVQRTLKTLLQHHSSKASILRHSAFFYGPTLTSIPDHCKDHSIDYMELCWQSDVSAF